MALVLTLRARATLHRALGVCFALGVIMALTTPPASGADGTLSPPVIKESFTKLPCNQATTIGLEGCAEGRLLTSDHRINAEVALIFHVLRSPSQRRSFVSSENLWFTYRVADCTSVASLYQGGTLAPVEFANCEVTDNQSRSVDLHAHYELVEQDNSSSPAWP